MILFNGYIKHIGLSIGFVETIRPVLPEVFALAAVFSWMIQGRRLLREDVGFWCYFIYVCLLSVPSCGNLNSVLSIVRDMIIPFFLLSILSTIRLSQKDNDQLMIVIRNIFALFIIIGFFAAVQQKILGWRWTSNFFVGEEVWGVDRNLSIRISSGWLGFKVLGTTGSAETFGFYSAFAVLYLPFFGFRKLYINWVLIGLAMVNILLSGMKTPFLIAVVIIFAIVFLPNRKKMGIVSKISIMAVGIGVFAYMIFSGGAWTESSMYMRLELWKDLASSEHIVNLLVPHSLFSYSDGAGNSGITGFWDNAYLYVAYSLGIFGLIAISRLLMRRFKLVQKVDAHRYMTYAYLFLALTSITTCVFFGRNVLGIFLIIVGLRTANARRVLS